MVGYRGYSKSNNAIEAESCGKMTASVLSKILKCSSMAIKAILAPEEWHHTSSHYNRTNYYFKPGLCFLARGDSIEEAIEEAIWEDDKTDCEKIWNYLKWHHYVLKKLRGFKSNTVKLADYAKIMVKEWSGSRNHPICKEVEYSVSDLFCKEAPGTPNSFYLWTDSRGKKCRKKYTNFVKWEAIITPHKEL